MKEEQKGETLYGNYIPSASPKYSVKDKK